MTITKGGLSEFRSGLKKPHCCHHSYLQCGAVWSQGVWGSSAGWAFDRAWAVGADWVGTAGGEAHARRIVHQVLL